MMTDYTIGSTISSFQLLRVEEIDEINSTVFHFTHTVLGTPVLAIKNNDPNKTFCIAFNTNPDDSTGVAHILEHSVLMGSKKYPVKDVFGEIHKGGLMTFLNAMTGSDVTFYPFATLNRNEYFNIMDVYCDVTFNPLLLETTFEQEGWHYHLEGDDHPLGFQGVVFNEMKGAFSDPIRSIFHHTYKGLLPGSTYAHESGGDPKNIPDLSYQQFLAFHRQNYHPSNAMLFFYGDADLEEELAFVQDRFLSHYPESTPVNEVVAGQLIRKPISITDGYAVQTENNLSGKTYLAVATAVGNILERDRNTAMQVIAQILYNSDASPLKKAILDSGLCKDFGGSFLTSSSFSTIMLTYLIGSESDSLPRFASVYESTLRALVKKGLDPALVLSELNKYEFSIRESLNKAQRGLDLIGRALVALKHGADPFSFLRINQLLEQIRSRALDDHYFEDLITDSLLGNPATVSITLSPDPNRSQNDLQREADRLKNFESTLNDSDRHELIQRTRQLLSLQTTPNDPETLALLPQLSLQDLDPSPVFHDVTAETLHGRPWLVSTLPTNGINYIDLGFDCSVIPPELLPYLSLYGTIVSEIGTSSRDYMQLAQDLATYTGGLDTAFNTYSRVEDGTDSCSPLLWFHLKALHSYQDKSLDILNDIFSSASFTDRKRIREIVHREYAWTDHSVQSEGYSLASSRAFSHLSKAGKYSEFVNGVTSFLALKKLVTNYEQLEDSFLADLERIHALLLRRDGLTLAFTGEDAGAAHFNSRSQEIITTLPETSHPSSLFQFPDFPPTQGFCTSAEVVFNVEAFSLFSSPGEYNGAFEVLKTWISRDYLWNTVRQMGGAYGCFAQFNHITGNIGFVSYRDPNVAKTYSYYEELPQQLASLSLSDQVLQQLIIGTYGGLVPHQSPAAIAATARSEYLSGVDSAFKQKRIEQVLQTSLPQIRSFAPLFSRRLDESFRASIGSSSKIKAASDYFDDIVEL